MPASYNAGLKTMSQSQSAYATALQMQVDALQAELKVARAAPPAASPADLQKLSAKLDKITSAGEGAARARRRRT